MGEVFNKSALRVEEVELVTYPRVLDSFERQHLLAWCRSTMHNPEHVARFMEAWLAEPGRDVEYYLREGWARVASACGAYEVDFALDSAP